MADIISPPFASPAAFSAAPLAAMTAGLRLFERRSAAMAEFWRSCADVREPTDLMAVQLNYWTQLFDDCQEAFTESVAQLNAAAPPASVAAAPQGVAGAA